MNAVPERVLALPAHRLEMAQRVLTPDREATALGELDLHEQEPSRPAVGPGQVIVNRALGRGVAGDGERLGGVRDGPSDEPGRYQDRADDTDSEEARPEQDERRERDGHGW